MCFGLYRTDTVREGGIALRLARQPKWWRPPSAVCMAADRRPRGGGERAGGAGRMASR